MAKMPYGFFKNLSLKYVTNHLHSNTILNRGETFKNKIKNTSII